MNIKAITKLLINAGIEVNEANIEVKMLLEHFCNYTEMDKLRGVELNSEQLDLIDIIIFNLEREEAVL